MQVDFNNLRSQTVESYRILVIRLNSLIKDGSLTSCEAEYLDSCMEDLRLQISTIASCSIAGDEDVKDVYVNAATLPIYNPF